MVAEIVLEKPMALGLGRYVQPPAGWDQEGWVTDNPLWLLPKSRLRWTPPGADRPAFHWDLSISPLPGEIMEVLMRILDGLPVPLDQERLKPLYPALIRMPLDTIKDARVMSYPRSGRLLRIEYEFKDYGDKGIVHYAPTEMYEYGEFQILAYEGKDPEYSQYLDLAQACMESFSIGQIYMPTEDGAPSPVVSGAQLSDDDLWKFMDEDEEEEQKPSMDFRPEAKTGEMPAPAAPVAPATPPAPAAPATPPAPAAPAAPVRQPEPQGQEPEALWNFDDSPPPPEPSPDFDEMMSKASDQSGGGFKTYVLQPGDTIRTVAKKAYPDLTPDQLMEKVKHIYALNLAKGNPIQAWDVKPGLKIYLEE